MDVPPFLAITLVAHACFAVGIAAHARFSGRDAGTWPHLALVVGVVGVVGYVAGADAPAVSRS